MHKRPLIIALLVCLAGSGLSGCASKYGEQTAVVKLHADCYDPIKALRAEEHRVAKATAGGAVAGGILGAVVGGLTGGTRGAIAGAVAGAAVGGASGYFIAVSKQNKDENARMARYLQDLEGDISSLTVATASARMAIQCYEKKFETSLAQYKEKAITREQLQESYTEIKSGLDEAQRILGTVIVSAQEGDAKYQAAITEEEKQLQQPASSRQQAQPQRRQTQYSPNSPKPAPAQASTSGSLDNVKAKQASYQSSIAETQKTQEDGKNASARIDAKFAANFT